MSNTVTTKASLFKRAKKAFIAAFIATGSTLGAELPGIFGMVGAQRVDPVVIWTDVATLITASVGAFYGTWRVTNSRVNGTPNTDSHIAPQG